MGLDVPLHSPHNGEPLIADSPHSLTDGKRRYPVVDGIAYLRVNRDALCELALFHLDVGQCNQARTLLMQDQDSWARTEKPLAEAIQNVVENNLSLRAAMKALNFGPVADYFAYRWSDPTFLSGLALLESNLPPGAKVLEVACGIGHYLREFGMRGVPAIGMDVVFSKLWLAKRYVAPNTTLVCADVEAHFPFGGNAVNTTFCHDAFYFFHNKRHVLTEMERVSGREGSILIGHTHCAEASNYSSGESLPIEGYQSLLPAAMVYDDAELTQSVLEARRPHTGASTGCMAIALVKNGAPSPHSFTMPIADLPLRVNPLLQEGELRWPSPRYRDEYADLSGYLDSMGIPDQPDETSIRRRIHISLPDHW